MEEYHESDKPAQSKVLTLVQTKTNKVYEHNQNIQQENAKFIKTHIVQNVRD